MICRLRLHMHVNLTISYSRLFGPALQQLSIVFDLWRKGYLELFGSIRKCMTLQRMLNQKPERSQFRHRVLLNLIKILRLVFTVFTWWNHFKAVAGKIPWLDPTSSCRSGANTASNCWTAFNFLFQNISMLFKHSRHTKAYQQNEEAPNSLLKVRKRMWQEPLVS